MAAQEIVQKKRSKKYLELIEGLTQDIQKLKPRIDAIFEEGRKCELSDMEIGKDIRFRTKPYYTRQHITELLPPTARNKSRGRPFSKKILQNEEPDIPGRWNIAPEEYELRYLNQYDNDLLIKIVKMLHKQKDQLQSTYSKWDAQVESIGRENKKLKARVQELETLLKEKRAIEQ